MAALHAIRKTSRDTHEQTASSVSFHKLAARQDKELNTPSSGGAHFDNQLGATSMLITDGRLLIASSFHLIRLQCAADLDVLQWIGFELITVLW